jgi:hypothetical protein
MCFVQGLIFGSLISSSAPELSSNALHLTIGSPHLIGAPLSRASSNRSIIGRRDWNASDIAIMYSSPSVVLNADFLCNLEPHITGHPYIDYELSSGLHSHFVKMHVQCSLLCLLPQEVCINPTLKRLVQFWVHVNAPIL